MSQQDHIKKVTALNEAQRKYATERRTVTPRNSRDITIALTNAELKRITSR